MSETSELIKINNVKKSFITADKQELLVLDEINFSQNEGEIIALLGKSGSGKSTLLRIIAGLIKPTSGDVRFKNQRVLEPVDGIAMVFQSFALLPWLTVLENVELGLEAQGVPAEERRRRALKAIDTIGLDGFESAYPKELSGGMRQRVGFARALVIEPELLLMDEPFSALDILTSENLRKDLLDLWNEKQTKIKGILCVTHDIEEAVILADRIVIFGSNPGTIIAEIPVKLPYPRNTQSARFKRLLEKVYVAMTTSERDKVKTTDEVIAPESEGFDYRIPEVDISELTGLLEAMVSHEKDGELHLSEVADDLHLDVNNLFPITEVLDLLNFAKIVGGEFSITEDGRKFTEADILQRKQLFANHLLNHLPIARKIRDLLDEDLDHRINEKVVIAELENNFSEEEADRIFRTIIDWGRYAEIFAYDYDSGELSLENPQ